MPRALLKVTGKYTGKSVVIRMVYNYVSSNTWSCLAGYLAATEGTWTTTWRTDSIFFYDEDDELVASTYETYMQPVGYPFDGLRGSSGPFSAYKRGILRSDTNTWEFTAT